MKALLVETAILNISERHLAVDWSVAWAQGTNTRSKKLEDSTWQRKTRVTDWPGSWRD